MESEVSATRNFKYNTSETLEGLQVFPHEQLTSTRSQVGSLYCGVGHS
jgi:hypothetical protein